MEVTIISDVEVILTVISAKSVNVKKNIIADPFLSSTAQRLKEISSINDSNIINIPNPKFFVKVSPNNQSNNQSLDTGNNGFPEEQTKIIKTSKIPDYVDHKPNYLYQQNGNETTAFAQQKKTVNESEPILTKFENENRRERNFGVKSSDRVEYDFDNTKFPLDTDKRSMNVGNIEDIQPDKFLLTESQNEGETEDSCDKFLECNDDITPNTVSESTTYVNMYVLDEIDRSCQSDLLSLSHQIDQKWKINGESSESNSCQNEQKTETNTTNTDATEEISDQFKCDICNKEFCGKRSLQRHLLTQRHLDKQTYGKHKRYKCDICQKDFPRNSNLQIHKRIHTGDKPYKCRYCGKRFTQKFTAYNHEKLHTGEKDYTCQMCEKSFRQKGDLNEHMKIHTGEKPFKCETCDKRFLRRSNFENHSKLHTNEKSLICELCGKGYNYKHNLVTHMKIHSENKSHICGICGRGFTQKSQFKRHTMVHSGLKPYVCEICGFQTADRSSLHSHMRRHTGERPYACDKCPKRFNKRTIWKRHQKVHENSADKRKRKNLIVKRSFSCDICQKTFSKNSKLKRHLGTQKHKSQVSIQSEQLSTNIILLTLPDDYQQ